MNSQTSLTDFFKTKKGIREVKSVHESVKVSHTATVVLPPKSSCKEKCIKDISLLITSSEKETISAPCSPKVDIGAEVDVHSAEKTPSSTPKRKYDWSTADANKKRKEVNGPSHVSKTPECFRINTSDVPRSAKKKLEMGELDSTVKDVIITSNNEDVSPPIAVIPVNSPKKLTPAEVKECLGKCGRLDELRARLLKVNQCEQKLRNFKATTEQQVLINNLKSATSRKAEHPQLQKFTSLSVEVPISPRKSPTKTPSKSPLKPAYQRFQHLIETPSTELNLPYKYKFLKEIFRAVDTVVSMLHNRHEVITFGKLKSAVQEMLKKSFYERQLGELKTVFPLAYFFQREKIKNSMMNSSSNASSSQYELTVTTNMEYKGINLNLLNKINEESLTSKQFRKMDSVILVERRNIFHNSLVEIVRQYHDDFLKSFDPPIQSEGHEIRRWHPSFDLDDVPDIESSPLPQPPDLKIVSTAQDALDKARNVFSMYPRLESALQEAANCAVVGALPEVPMSATPPSAPPAALRGVSAGLLEKIRAREAAKASRGMTRTPAATRELEILSRLPEIARIVRNHFVTEKKAAIMWETLVGKIANSYSSILDHTQIDAHLKLLLKEIPDWCSLHIVRSGTFVKIDKERQLNDVINLLTNLIKQRS